MRKPPIYNQFSQDYNALFEDVISDFSLHFSNQHYGKEYCAFYPSFGTKPNEKCEFIIYGQAVNGWPSKFNLGEEINTSNIEDYIIKSNSYLNSKNHSPLDWVNIQWCKSVFEQHLQDENISDFYYYENLYFACNSFFWNVCYKLISDFYGFDRGTFQWSKKMIWSNLYKIALPKENPTKIEKAFQIEKSVALFKKEIEEINPKYCVLLTNQPWFDEFNKILKLDNIFPNPNDTILSMYHLNDTSIIVTSRPFFGNGEKHVTEILNIL